MGASMKELSEAAIRFLHELRKWKGCASNTDLRILVTREQDAGRRQCVRRKLAYYAGGYWRLTDRGREFMK